MGMGSIIQSTPLLMTLRNNFPKAEITFITVPKNYPLLSIFPFIDRIVLVNDKSAIELIITTLKSLFQLWINRTDVFIDLEIYSYISTIFTVLSFPKYKIGFYRKESRIQLGVYSKMIYFNTKAPVKNIYLQAAYLLNCKTKVVELYDYKNLFENGLNTFSAKLGELVELHKKYIVINPNASDLRIERKWALDNFSELINIIMQTYPDEQIVLTGSEDEKDYVEKLYNGIKKEYHSRVINSSGKLTLNELIAVIRNSRLMITNDSGPMHIAFALKKETIALFGPCSPIEYMTQKNVCFVYKNIYCSPCVHHFSISPCNGDNQCMKLIQTNEVMEILNKIYNNEIKWNSDSFGNGILYNLTSTEKPFGIVDRKTK